MLCLANFLLQSNAKLIIHVLQIELGPWKQEYWRLLPPTPSREES